MPTDYTNKILTRYVPDIRWYEPIISALTQHDRSAMWEWTRFKELCVFTNLFTIGLHYI